MAINSVYTERFRSSFTTTSNRQWQIQIFDRVWNGSQLGVFDITDSGLTLSYDCDGDEKFAPIVGCKASLNFMVDKSDSLTADFINDILGLTTSVYAEGDIVLVVREGPADTGTIIFEGEYLMDLDTLPDVTGNYPIQLTFTDGLGKLKEISFESSNVDTTTSSYNAMAFQTFAFWIAQCLQHTKKYKTQANPNGFWDNASSTLAFYTTVRWWNHDFYYESNSVAAASDPLVQTKGKMSWANKFNPSNGQVNIASAYEVLSQICRSWGMRVIYWNGGYHFVQIFEYNKTASAGNWSVPIDQYTARYRANGDEHYFYMTASIGGTKYDRFENKFANIINPQHNIEKLEGTTYTFLPVLNEVKTNLIHEGYQNIFPGFPQPSGYGTNFTQFIGGPFTNSAQYKYECTFKIQMTAGTHWSLSWGYTVDNYYIRIIAMTPSSSPTLAAHALATLTYDPIADTYGWDDTATYTGFDLGPTIQLSSGNGPHAGAGATSIVNLIPNLKFTGYRDADTDYALLVSSPVYISGINGVLINIQTGSPYGSTAISTVTNPIDAGALQPPSWSTGIFNNFLSQIQPVSTQSATSNTVFVNNQTEDSHKLDWGDVFWGDGPEFWDNSALRIQTGANTWEFSSWTDKNWLRRDYLTAGTPPANSGFSFNQLLNYQIKQCQATVIKRANFSTVNNFLGFSASNGKPYFANPLGIIEDCDVDTSNVQLKTKYFFRRGVFDVFKEQWEGEWIETEAVTPAGSNPQSLAGGGNLNGNGTTIYGNGGSSAGSSPRISVFVGTEAILKNVAITSLAIGLPDGNMVLGTNFNAKTGDKVYLRYLSGTVYEVALTSDITSESTSISFTSITPTESSNGNVAVQLPLFDIWEQSNRKTRGTMAGFDISATGMTKGGIVINGFIDSDTMTGASRTKLPTSLSVKNYVDASSGGGLEVFSMLTCTTTTITSATDGVANAVVMKFDAESITEGPSGALIVYGSDGIEGIGNSQYCWMIKADPSALRYFEFSFNVTTNTNTVNNRILSGFRLQTGTIGGETINWTTIDPTTSYVYDRGTGSVRKGSTAGSIIIAQPISEVNNYFRMQYWRESGTSGVKSESVLNGTQISIKQLK